ncbi:MAG: DUF916 domain-containing protein [Actinomycetota bacterium]|nr:DUF916 domain-containing protein [Actinomycetota bacterium]
MRRVMRVVVLMAAVAGTSFATGGPVAADDEGTDVVSALVAPGSQTDPNGSYYVLVADPGDSINQTIVVRNDRPHAVEAHIEAVDAFTRDATGAGYGAPGSAPTGTGTWIVVHTPVLTLQPGEELPIDFTVHVPADAEPGEYLAGMSASVPLSPTTETAEVQGNAADVQITLQGQRLIAVQVNVPGPAEPLLAVTGVRPVATPDGLALMLGLENEGNAFAKGTGTVRVDSTGLRTGFDIDTFVSHTKIDYRVVWTDEVIVGNHDVAVQLEYGDDLRVSWNGTIEITAAMKGRLDKELADLTIGGGGGSSLPIPLLVAGLVATAICIGGAVGLRRRRSARPNLSIEPS